MSEILEVILRTVFLYVLMIVTFRLMGKREVGELSIIDLAVFILIAEVAAFALDDVDKQLVLSILPIICLLLLQIISSYVSMKSKKFRDMIDGDPVIIIENGVINEREMRGQRYNLDDLLQQLREQSVASVSEVSFAYLEASGHLSIYRKDEDAFAYPMIVDGEIQQKHLQLVQKDEAWLLHQLAKQQITDVSQVFLCTLERNDQLFIQKKSSAFTDNGT